MANIAPTRGATAAQAALIDSALQAADTITRTIKTRYGTTAQRGEVTPQTGELFIDTTLNTLYRGDGSTAGGLALIPNLNSPASIIIGPTGGTLIENGANLLAAYASAKALTPYGNAKAALNKAWLGLLPGIYDLRSAGSGLAIDTEHLNIVGLGRRPEDVMILVSDSASRIVTQTADNVTLSNFTIYNDNNAAQFAFNGGDTHSFANTVHDSLFFTGAGGTTVDCHSFASLLSNTFSGTYRRCRATQAKMYGGLADGWLCNAIFEDCQAYTGSLAASINASTYVSFSGRQTRCRIIPGGDTGSITLVAGAIIEDGYYKTVQAAQDIFKVSTPGGATPVPIITRCTIIAGTGNSIDRKGTETDGVFEGSHLRMGTNGIIGSNLTNSHGTDAQAFNLTGCTN